MVYSLVAKYVAQMMYSRLLYKLGHFWGAYYTRSMAGEPHKTCLLYKLYKVWGKSQNVKDLYIKILCVGFKTFDKTTE